MVERRCDRYVQIFGSVDLEVVGELPDGSVGWIISAEYAARSRQILGRRIGVANRLVVDPVTWRLDPDLRWMLAPDGGLKPIYRRLIEAYRVPTDEMPWRLRGSDALERYVIDVLEFQERQLDTSRTPTDDELFGVDLLPPSTRRVRPDRLLTPTVLVTNRASLEDQETLWAATPSEFRGLPVDLALVISGRSLADSANVRAIAAAMRPGRRIWIFVTQFRSLLRTSAGVEAASAIRPAVRRLLDRGPVGLLQAGHHLAMLVVDGVDAIAFALHLEGGGERKSRGGPALPYGYVTAAHGLASFDDIRPVLLDAADGDTFAHWYCPDPLCVQRFERLGASAYVREMFTAEPTLRGWQAAPASRALQRRHGVRARLMELDRIMSMPERDLMRVLAAEARQSPFDLARQDLEAWLDAFARERVMVR